MSRLTRASVCTGLVVWPAVFPCFGAAAANQNRRHRQVLDPNDFRQGLRKRGLIELLEFHLDHSPAGDELEAELLRRDILLAAYADASRTSQERTAALARANQVLTKLIAAHADDARALQWRLDLGRSLLYQQAEPYTVRVLYRGGTPEDRQALGRITARALETFDVLLARLIIEFERLDELTLAEFERLERSGHIEQVERLEPLAKYMRRWALFYRAVARQPNDPARIEELQSIEEELRDDDNLLTVPHEVTHVQAQSLLLSGAVARRLGDSALALEQLTRAIEVIDGLADPAEQADLHWAAMLARVERVRALGASRRYDQAVKAVDDFRAWIASTSPDNLGARLVAAFLETWVVQAQARRAAAAGNAVLARRLANQALGPLIALARQNDAARDAVYADLYTTLEPNVDSAALHPFARCALIAGLLAEASAPPPATDGPGAVSPDEHAAHCRLLLDRAIAVAEQTLSQAGQLDDEQHAEVLYNLGVACYRRGKRLAAARAFVQAAEGFPKFRRAESAVTLAVQTTAELYQDPTLRLADEVRGLHLQALELLMQQYPDSPAAAYWQFFHAQTLEELGRFDQAASQYARVVPGHEHHVEARFAGARCLAEAVRELAETGAAEPAELTRRSVAAVRAARQFRAAAAGGRFQVPDSVTLDRLAARAAVLEAEVAVLPGVERHRQALEALEGFEQRYPQAADLIGRILRARIIAYQGLGWLAQAEQEIPRYLASDPEHAVATLQALFDSTTLEIERLRNQDRHREALGQARSALLLAEQIQAWSVGPQAGLSDHDRSAVVLQLAEACLAAGEVKRAYELFQGLTADGADTAGQAITARAFFGLAETLAGLDRHAEALPHYNRLHRQVAKNTSLWWRALLGDLRCRTQLGEDPAGVIRVIEQHRYLYRGKLGGQQLQARFQALLERNRQRLASGG